MFYYFEVPNSDLGPILKALGYGIPLIEMALAIWLIFPASRKIAFWVAVAAHSSILIFVSANPGRLNSIVIPWNIGMMIMDFLMFYRTNDAIMIIAKGFRVKWITAFMIFCMWLLPVLNFAGWWDNYLSFSLFK